MKRILMGGAAALALILPGSAGAVTLTSLIGGGTLAIEDVVFSNFSFTDVGGANAPSTDNIDVLISSAFQSVSLSFIFSPTVFTGPGAEDFEFEIDFDADVAFGPRHIDGMRYTIATRGGVSSAVSTAFIEFGSLDFGALAVDFDSNGTNNTIDTLTFAPTTSVSPGFFSAGETDGLAEAQVNRFAIALTMDSTFDPNAVIPLPASLGFLALGLGGLGLVARRKRV